MHSEELPRLVEIPLGERVRIRKPTSQHAAVQTAGLRLSRSVRSAPGPTSARFYQCQRGGWKPASRTGPLSDSFDSEHGRPAEGMVARWRSRPRFERECWNFLPDRQRVRERCPLGGAPLPPASAFNSDPVISPHVQQSHSDLGRASLDVFVSTPLFSQQFSPNNSHLVFSRSL